MTTTFKNPPLPRIVPDPQSSRPIFVGDELHVQDHACCGFTPGFVRWESAWVGRGVLCLRFELREQKILSEREDTWIGLHFFLWSPSGWTEATPRNKYVRAALKAAKVVHVQADLSSVGQ